MSWIDKLYKTYENNLDSIGNDADPTPLLPVSHTTQNAHIQIDIDGLGNFLRASVIPKNKAKTIIPATEEAAGRAGSKPACFPLCDKLQYLAGDFVAFGGRVTSGFSANPREPHDNYLKLLGGWCESSVSNPKVNAVLEYVKRGKLVADLVDAKVLYVGNGKLLAEWSGPANETPEIFKVILSDGGQSDAFVRFSVQCPGDRQSDLWSDPSAWDSWASYYASQKSLKGLCYVTGEEDFLADQHPAKIRNGGDKAKLISSNDTSGFTFRGRFLQADEACGVGFRVTQKAHSALRWLISKQGRRDGDQAVVAWAVSGADVPDLQEDTYSLLFGDEQKSSAPSSPNPGYTAEHIGLALKSKMAGYAAKLKPTDDIVVMGLDSATPGRMAIRYYRELTGSELLERVQAWHMGCAWLQRFGKDKVFWGAPAPRDIAETAYGRRVDEKLRKATVERLLPCIVDGATLPGDLVESCVRRASNKNGIEDWEWEKALGIACALYRKQNEKEGYRMALDENRNSRDYLYGRLLALAENLEHWALRAAGENRPTNAERLMQRFADHPYSTWRTIELALIPYKARLGGKSHKLQTLIDVVHSKFDPPEEYKKDDRLSGEFLLGYHCQRVALKPVMEQDTAETIDESAASGN